VERIEDFIRRWRSRYEGDRVFRVLVAAVVLVALAATGASLMLQPTYEASAQVWVDQEQGTGNGKIQLIPNAPTPETLQTIILTMIHTIDSRPVAQETIQRLGLQMKASELLDKLTVEQVEGTSFIRLTYEDTDPERARLIVNTVGKVSSERISPISAVGSKFTATVWEKPSVPTTPASPRHNGFLTLVIALVLCAGIVVAWRDVARGERPTRQEVGIVERVKEQELLQALGRRGKLTAVEVALETWLSVDEAERMLFELAARGHLQVIVEHGRLYYAHWGDRGEDRA
jgi:capsular polysaccharide biosynthesis protein